MLKLLVCAALLTGLVAADYDFQDSDFNELLVDELTADVDDDVMEALRFKRGTDAEPMECRRKKGKREKESHCCNGEKANPDEMKAVKEVKKACVAEARGDSAADDVSYDPLNCDGVQTMRQQMVCAAECMAKKFDLIDGGGEMKRDAVLNQTRRVAGDNMWKIGVLEEYVDKCLDGVKSAKEAKQTDGVAVKATCNPSPLEFHHCIWRKFVEGCPAESQIDSKKCKKIRERLAKGDTSAANKFFKHRPHHRH